MTTCNRCGKTVGTNDWDIHTCTPKQESESNKAAYQRGYLDGIAKPCIECADRKWVGLTDAEIEDCYGGEINDFARAIEAKLKEKNT